jgi:hypothetical protein
MPVVGEAEMLVVALAPAAAQGGHDQGRCHVGAGGVEAVLLQVDRLGEIVQQQPRGGVENRGGDVVVLRQIGGQRQLRRGLEQVFVGQIIRMKGRGGEGSLIGGDSDSAGFRGQRRRGERQGVEAERRLAGAISEQQRCGVRRRGMGALAEDGALDRRRGGGEGRRIARLQLQGREKIAGVLGGRRRQGLALRCSRARSGPGGRALGRGAFGRSLRPQKGPHFFKIDVAHRALRSGSFASWLAAGSQQEMNATD